jgi:ABC-2 type transport system ATP-binding protein
MTITSDTRPWVIETTGLTKRYGDVEAVTQLTLRVRGGCITGFLGRNGAGKSSTIKMLLGMMHPTSGSGRVLGRPIDEPRESREIRRRVAYVAEDKQTYAYMTVGQMIAFTRSFYDDWRPEFEARLLRQYDLPVGRKVKALSKGMRTKLALLLALARQPQLLILDEPSEGLDPVSIEELLQALVGAAAEGTAVFFSSHQIAEVERIADHVCVIDRGRLVVDASLDEIREQHRRIELGFAKDPPAWVWRGEGIGSVRTNGRQITIIARGNADAIIEHAYGIGAVSVESSAVSLREVFLDSVAEQA